MFSLCKNERLQENESELKGKIRRLALQIRSKEIVASILEDDSVNYDFIESKQATANKQPNAKPTETVDPKSLKEIELMKKRNEHLLQILLEFENENKLLEKGLVEINEKIHKLNETDVKKKNKSKETAIIKCPSLEKLLNVNSSSIFFKINPI
jgi:hypothetical protein